ncbi:hypothetical protein LJB42_003538 [Komagataella kurtzmanii]|nr:hypothetical protein LJB42_003538 [Komagataella kurtzmanii]
MSSNLKIDSSIRVIDEQSADFDQDSPVLSFKKQPIKTRTASCSTISNLTPDFNSYHLTLKGSFRDSSEVSSTQDKTQPAQPDNNPDDLDYDAKIRAPKMSSQSLFKSNPIKIAQHEPFQCCDISQNSKDQATKPGSVETSQTDNKEFSRNTSNLSNDSLTSAETKVAEEVTDKTNSTFTPATFDINQPLRRHSIDEISSDLSNTLPGFSTNASYSRLDNLQNAQNGNNPMSFSNRGSRNGISGPIRQINEPKTPNYVPAVLRPSSSHSLVVGNTPQFQLGSSSPLPDEEDDNSSYDDDKLYHYSSSENHANTARFPYTMVPIKSHWLQNNKRSSCMDCQVKFSLLFRRHHCRHCGDIFCSNCLTQRASLNLMAKFDLVHGMKSKVCNGCAKSWNQYLVKQYNNNVGSSVSKLQVKQTVPDEDPQRERMGSIVPSDWTWSSF